MLLNYLKLTFRLLQRNPFFTLINVTGLSVGFAVFFVLWHHAEYELNSDQFHKDHERIFRVYSDFYYNTGIDWTHYLYGSITPVFATIAREKFTAIEGTTRLIHQKNFDEVRWEGVQTDTAGWSELDPNITLFYFDRQGDKSSFKETKAAYADPNFFDFFSIQLIRGKADQVLSHAEGIVLSESIARKYFGHDDPLGKTLLLNDSQALTVTGVFQDFPHNSHLNADLLFSTLRIQHAIENVSPFQQSAVNYFKVREGVSIAELEDQVTREHRKHWQFDDDFPGSVLTLYLQPLKEVPFRIFDNDVFVPKSRDILSILQIVAIVVLLMALINYLNLKISTQNARMKELATRKTSGARKVDFIKQFFIESIVMNAMAILVALTLIQLFRFLLEVLFQFYLPAWNEISIPSMSAFACVMLVSILVAGLHPALSMWRLSISKIFYHAKPSGKTIRFSVISTVLQFIIATSLIVWLVTVSNQLNFLTNDTWGLDRDRVVVVEMPVHVDNDIRTEIRNLKNELLATAGIADVTLSTTVAGDLLENRIGFSRMDTAGLFVVSKSDGGVDERFIPFYNLKLLAGRNFLADNPTDKNTIILSRIAAESAGMKPEEAIGKRVQVEKYSWRPFSSVAEIIGVIDDHRYNPLYLETSVNRGNRGTILTYDNYLFSKNLPQKMAIRIKGANDVVEAIQNKYEEIFPGEIFHWYFLEDHMNVHYQSETFARNQITLFTLIAMGIACLGLLGMITNKVVEKTKEIGIRKVLGAQIHQIAQILLNTTMKQVILATLIGVPLAYYLSQQYLQKFSDRVEQQWWHYAIPVGIFITILFCTISTVVWKAARTNPVESLRYE
jgi:putative ABC transport system permease protein